MDDKLIAFLKKAKNAGYAAGAAADKRKMADGGTELEYADGDLVYRDRYYGGDPFIGEEVLFAGGKAVWGMNFRGFYRGTDLEFFADTYRFLQEALRNNFFEYPLRGPESYHKEDFAYHCIIQGDMEGFFGSEEILYKESILYSGMIHGGSISSLMEE